MSSASNALLSPIVLTDVANSATPRVLILAINLGMLVKSPEKPLEFKSAILLINDVKLIVAILPKIDAKLFY